MKWHAHRDSAGWSFGWYPTPGGDGMLALQKITGYCINLDVGAVRIRLTYRRNSLEEAQRRYLGLGPMPRVAIEW